MTTGKDLIALGLRPGRYVTDSYLTLKILGYGATLLS